MMRSITFLWVTVSLQAVGQCRVAENLQCPDILLIWIVAGQGLARSAAAGGWVGCVFSLLIHVSPIFLILWIDGAT